MHSANSIVAISACTGERSPASTTRVCLPCSAKAVHRRSSKTPPKATCGFATTGTKRTRACAKRRRNPSAWSNGAGREWSPVIVVFGCSSCRCSCVQTAARLGALLGRGEDQVHVARIHAVGGAGGRAQSAVHERMRRQAVPVFRHALAAGHAPHRQLVGGGGRPNPAALPRLLLL